MDAAPAHTQIAPTKDLRTPAQGTVRALEATNKWKNGARAGPGRTAGDEEHLSPAGPHPIHPRKGGDRTVQNRRSKSIAFDPEAYELAHGDLLPGSPRAPSGKIGTSATRGNDSDDEEYSEDDYQIEDSSSEVPLHPDARNAYSKVIDEAEKRAADAEYALVDDDLEIAPTNPVALKKYLEKKKRAEANEYVLVDGENKEEKL